MNYHSFVGKVWKTKMIASNGNIDWAEIKLSQVAKFARAERKRAGSKDFSLDFSLTPTTKWVIGLALRDFEEYVKMLDGKEDIKLKSITIQCVEV